MKKIIIATLFLVLFSQFCFADTKAKRIQVDVSQFNNNLTPAATDVQKALNQVDDLTNVGKREIEMVVFDFTAAVAIGDGKFYFHVGQVLNGMDLIYVHARVVVPGTTGLTNIQINNVTDGVDMLSTRITIDSGELGSHTAAIPPVIDTIKDDVVENDLLRVDVDTIPVVAPKGLIVTLGFKKP